MNNIFKPATNGERIIRKYGSYTNLTTYIKNTIKELIYIVYEHKIKERKIEIKSFEIDGKGYNAICEHIDPFETKYNRTKCQLRYIGFLTNEHI